MGELTFEELLERGEIKSVVLFPDGLRREDVENLRRAFEFGYKQGRASLEARLRVAEERDDLVRPLRELSGYVRAHLAGQDADPELKWALGLADEALATLTNTAGESGESNAHDERLAKMDAENAALEREDHRFTDEPYDSGVSGKGEAAPFLRESLSKLSALLDEPMPEGEVAEPPGVVLSEEQADEIQNALTEALRESQNSLGIDPMRSAYQKQLREARALLDRKGAG